MSRRQMRTLTEVIVELSEIVKKLLLERDHYLVWHTEYGDVVLIGYGDVSHNVLICHYDFLKILSASLEADRRFDEQSLRKREELDDLKIWR